MKIGLIQTKIHPDVSLNLKEVKKAIIEGVHQNAEIFILPEMWNCPYVNEMIRKSVSFYEESKALLQELSGTVF